MRGLLACLHNFTAYFLAISEPSTHIRLFDEVFTEVGNPKHIIYEVVTKHFRTLGKQHLLNRGLRLVLDATDDLRLETI